MKTVLHLVGGRGPCLERDGLKQGYNTVTQIIKRLETPVKVLIVEACALQLGVNEAGVAKGIPI